MEVLQRVDKVLLHLHVQGVLDLGQLAQGFTHVDQSHASQRKQPLRRSANSSQGVESLSRI